jgi:hypothetical protein
MVFSWIAKINIFQALSKYSIEGNKKDNLSSNQYYSSTISHFVLFLYHSVIFETLCSNYWVVLYSLKIEISSSMTLYCYDYFRLKMVEILNIHFHCCLIYNYWDFYYLSFRCVDWNFQSCNPYWRILDIKKISSLVLPCFWDPEERGYAAPL